MSTISERDAAILQTWDDGNAPLSLRQIGKIHDVTRSTVSGVIFRDRERRGLPAGANHGGTKSETTLRIEAALREQPKASHADIAGQLDVTIDAVRYVSTSMRAADPNLPRRSPPRHLRERALRETGEIAAGTRKAADLKRYTDEPEPLGPLGDISDGCKWVHGDPQARDAWRYCGHPQSHVADPELPQTPYCPFHARKCYQPATVHRDVRSTVHRARPEAWR